LLNIFRWLPVLAPLLVFILAYRAWSRSGRDPAEESYVVHYEPVEGMSPAELGTLIDNRADMADITATLVDLAVRGFVRIEEQSESHMLGLSKNTDYTIHILRDAAQRQGLKRHEQLYLQGLDDATTSDATSVKMSELADRFYTSIPLIKEAIYDSLISKGYYIKRPDEVMAKWIFLGALAAFAGIMLAVLSTKMLWSRFSTYMIIGVGLASALILFGFAELMPVRTIAGARAREATLGFREFLSRVDSERFKKMITSPEMFEKFLPYAMAFGVADKWAKAFEDIYREPPTWYVGSTGTFNAMSFSQSISSMSSAASSSMASSPGSSGSGSGGGGSSGGGSGGGGGGGF
jgi:uncharacterized membrane protein